MRGQNVRMFTKVIEVGDQKDGVGDGVGDGIEGEVRVKGILMDRLRALTVKSCAPKL